MIFQAKWLVKEKLIKLSRRKLQLVFNSQQKRVELEVVKVLPHSLLFLFLRRHWFQVSDKVFQDSDDDLSDSSTASAKSAEFSDVPEKREEQVTTKSDELNTEQGEESISSLSKKMTGLENMVMGQLMEIKEMVRDVILNQLEQARLPTEHVAGGGNEENQLKAIVNLKETVQEKLEEIKVKVGEAPAIQPPALAVEEIYPTAFGIKRTKDMELLNSTVCVQVKAYLYIFH